jgi:hypothetical protein
MPHAWSYVGAGYGVATVALTTYVAWIFRRTRRLRKALDVRTDA